MNKVSTVIITKNEESNIERCLKSVIDFSDEIVVVDSYSEDGTIEICKNFNCKILQVEWEGFGKAKKYAVNNSKNDWIFSIDADEEVTENLKKKIKTILQKPEKIIYSIKRNSFFLGKHIKYCGWNNDYPKRLFNKQHANFNEAIVHETVVYNGDRGIIEEPLNHYTYPTVEKQMEKLELYANLGAEKLFKEGKSSNQVMASFLGIFRFIKMYFLQLGFLDGIHGLILSKNTAYGVYLKYKKLSQLGK